MFSQIKPSMEQLYRLGVEKKNFPKKVTLIYKGNIPHVAFYLSHGLVEFSQKNKVVFTVNPGNLLFSHYLLRRQRVDYDIVITKGSSVYAFTFYDLDKLASLNAL